MKFWVDFETPPTQQGPVFSPTPAYLEVETPSADQGDAGRSFTYLVPIDQSNFVAAASWGHGFDHLVEFIFHPKLGSDWVAAYSEAWPTFGELLGNAAQGRYSNGSLVNFEDPDDGERKWFVITFIGNAGPYESYDAALQDGRIESGLQLVFLRSAALAQEMERGTGISLGTKAKLFAKSAFQGYTEAIDQQLVWLSRLSQLSSN